MTVCTKFILIIFMKKISFFVLAVLFAASCSIDGGYNQSYDQTISFEYNVDYDEVFGEDSLYFDNVGKKGLMWNDLAFMHKVTDDGTFQGGFILSHLNPAGKDAKPKDQVVSDYRVTGSASKKGNTYAVYKMNKDQMMMPERDFQFLMKDYGTCTVSHCLVNNTETVYDAAKKFENGDKLVLTATGYLNGAVTGTAEINLALPDTTIYNWTKFDLSKLGNVDAIDFDLYSSRSDIPTMFCLDEMKAHVDISY